MTRDRENWIAAYNNGRYIVIDKTTNSIINNAQGYGFKNGSNCWNWIRNQQRQVGIILSKESISNALFLSNRKR